jgi:predicted enzyme related to lactoylglutathione lyase
MERTYPHGVTCWIDSEQSDVEAAQEFYGGLFGWEFTVATPPDAPARYVVATLDGQDVAALAEAPDVAPGAARWNTYVAVDDADATVERAVSLGATVVSPAADAGPGGRGATLLDPAGCEVRLWQARRRKGAQLVNSPGAWNFSNLRATDPAAAQRFYGELFGWRFTDQEWATAIGVPGYGDHLEATVDPGIRARQAAAPEGFADVIGALVPAGGGAPGWFVEVTVADRDAAATRAEALGGTVLSTSETGWTRQAVIRDPQGAQFTASQFTPPDDGG